MTDTRAAFDQFTKAINAHDLDALARHYSPDVVITGPEGTMAGVDAATDYFRGMFAGFPDLSINVWSKVTVGELVVDEWTLTGTNTGPVQLPDGSSVPSTGRTVTLRGCDVAAVENGEVTSHRMYFDQADLHAQLGLGS